MVPDPWSIIDGLHKALADYLALGKKPLRKPNPNTSPSPSPGRGSLDHEALVGLVANRVKSVNQLVKLSHQLAYLLRFQRSLLASYPLEQQPRELISIGLYVQGFTGRE